MTSHNNFDVGREWLASHERQPTIVLGARSALRAIPVFGMSSETRTDFDENWEKLTLQLFRTNFLAWACAHFSEPSSNLKTQVIDANKDMLIALPAVPDHVSRQAVFAASKVSSAIATSNGDSSISAGHTADTVAAGTFASKYRMNALRGDFRALLGGKSATEIIQSPLWLTSQSKSLTDSWKQLEIKLAYLGHDWDVWTDWYVSRVFGRPLNPTILDSWCKIPAEFWNAGPQVVNAYLKQLSSGQARPTSNFGQPEPELEPGPEFKITSSGGLSLKSPYRDQEQIDEKTQQVLHERLRGISATLADVTKKTSNAYPGLLVVVTEYNDLVSQAFEQIDIVSLWAVGAGLLANRDAFARAQDARIMTTPLEPAHFALLQQTAELHGGFILGFPKARELSERADQARLSGEAMEKVVSLARSIIDDIRRSGHHVEESTRKFLAAIEEGLVEPGWRITRAGYAAYVVTRNALIAIGRLLSWANSAFATVAGGILLSSMDPGLAHTQFWIEFTLKHSQQILAFSEPFPELRVWLAAQIDAAQQDATHRAPPTS